MAEYVKDGSGRNWWCNAHSRRATHILIHADGRREHVCDPSLRGILLPCGAGGVVDLTDEIELVEE